MDFHLGKSTRYSILVILTTNGYFHQNVIDNYNKLPHTKNEALAISSEKFG